MGILETIFSVMVIILIIILFIVIILWLKYFLNEKLNGDTQEKSKVSDDSKKQATNTKKSVLSFMDFEKIEDNMIITKNGKKYIMVIECQGINYDLMSEIEKNGVETGFLQFLNSLRHPIQLYLQTRTVNLTKSLIGYKDRMMKYETAYREAERLYVQIANDPNSTNTDIINAKIEYNRKKNVYEYTKDVIQNTERISQNKNVLTRKYYIVISQFVTENKDEKEDLEEKVEEVFQELYTKCQSIIRTLASCSIQGKILNSEELIELMYIAYNRDEYDTYGMDKAIQAGYDELYSTGEDAFLKRINLLDKLIEDKAKEKVNGLVEVARTEQERAVQDRERNMNQYINAMAKVVLEKNKNVIGEEITEIVSQELEKEAKKAERVKTKVKEGTKHVDKKENKKRRSEQNQ